MCSLVVALKSILFAFLFCISSLPLTSSKPSGSLLNDKIINPSNLILVKDSRLSRPVVEFLSLGGPRGAVFNDLQFLNYVVGIHSVSISFTNKINSLLVTYAMAGGELVSSLVHGKVLGHSIKFTLSPHEHIWEITGETDGHSVKRITFRTTGPNGKCAVYGPYGQKGKYSFMIESHVLAFHGRSSNCLNSIGVYGLKMLTKSLQHGGLGGKLFDEAVSFNFPPIVEIRGFKIWNGVIFDAFQVEYLTLEGKIITGRKHGGGGSDNVTEIIFEAGEHLLAVYIEADKMLVNQLTLVTRKGNGAEVVYGPFGSCHSHLGCSKFSFRGDIIGFHGSAGAQVDRIGVYYLTD